MTWLVTPYSGEKKSIYFAGPIIRFTRYT